MRSGGLRQQSDEPGVWGDFDTPAVGHKAGALVEGERLGMVQRAGVEEEAGGVVGPCLALRVDHEGMPGALADKVGGHTEERDFDVGEGPAVEFQDALIAVVRTEEEDVDLGVGEEGREFVVTEAQAAEPEPAFADGAEDAAVAFEIRFSEAFDRECRGRLGELRRLPHFEIGDHGGDVPRGHLEITFGKH